MVTIKCSGGIATTNSAYKSKALQIFYEIRLKPFYINGKIKPTAFLPALQSMLMELKKPQNTSTQQQQKFQHNFPQPQHNQTLPGRSL